MEDYLICTIEISLNLLSVITLVSKSCWFCTIQRPLPLLQVGWEWKEPRKVENIKKHLFKGDLYNYLILVILPAMLYQKQRVDEQSETPCMNMNKMRIWTWIGGTHMYTSMQTLQKNNKHFDWPLNILSLAADWGSLAEK